MKAMLITPGDAGSARVAEIDEPPGSGSILVDGVLVGICGTDAEIASGAHGRAPEGESDLVLGHESLGRVVEAPSGSGFTAGDLVVGIVRRPDPVPCRPCGLGAWDMCRNGGYTERGIKELHGFGARQWRIEPEYAVKVDPALGDAGILLEPASVVAKAWDHIERIGARSPVLPRRALVTGAGPIGLLAALLGVQRGLEVHVLDHNEDGPKPDLVRDLGATYHSGRIDDVPEPDVVVECTGVTDVIVDVLGHHRRAGIVCLTGVTDAGSTAPIDVGGLNRQLVLENDVVFGTVNANRAHYELGAAALAAADRAWLLRIITRKVPLDDWPLALEREDDDVKVVVDLGG